MFGFCPPSLLFSFDLKASEDKWDSAAYSTGAYANTEKVSESKLFLVFFFFFYSIENFLFVHIESSSFLLPLFAPNLVIVGAVVFVQLARADKLVACTHTRCKFLGAGQRQTCNLASS